MIWSALFYSPNISSSNKILWKYPSSIRTLVGSDAGNEYFFNGEFFGIWQGLNFFLNIFYNLFSDFISGKFYFTQRQYVICPDIDQINLCLVIFISIFIPGATFILYSPEPQFFSNEPVVLITQSFKSKPLPWQIFSFRQKMRTGEGRVGRFYRIVPRQLYDIINKRLHFDTIFTIMLAIL